MSFQTYCALERSGLPIIPVSRRPMRRCFLHLGTHKTGTTSLQALLNESYLKLRELGYLYPRAGRPPEVPFGHHNIAWEISGDRGFRAENGGIEDLLAEIKGVPHDVIISSEDFECSLGRDGALPEFIRQLQTCGLHVIAV